MKKIIKTNIIVFVMLLSLTTGSISASATSVPYRTNIKGVTGIKELVDLSKTDDTAKYYLTLLDKPYFPVPKNGKLANFTFQPQGEYYFCTYGGEGNYYLFDFWGKENYAFEQIAKTDQEKLKLVYENQEDSIQIYQFGEADDLWTSTFLMNIHGFYMVLHGRQHNPNISTDEGYKLFDFKNLRELLASAEKEIKQINLDKTTGKLKKGKKLKLTATISNATSIKYIWKTSNKKVASITGTTVKEMNNKIRTTATIKAHKKGKAIITVTTTVGKAKCTIKVEK